ncbi:hypothetical protein [Nitrososphaeria virus YSH_462411]|uniref:Uncharacterized protein n=1 Tax=Nitrososphaeria virus YSH_462411 TaxID=3071321 RepID=A0A976UAI6_9CAUD|nr:hypothetical protein QKV92_gp40 [Yangshan Harbor Nitrososphaeria virus]UVF62312.1 hypothetical protein [Nitrososphaeria virus YSH_462411]
MCSKCNVRMDVYRTGEDDYEAECPKCWRLIN